MPELDVSRLLRQAVDPLRHEVAALQDLLERERRLQRDATARVVGPVDAVFDLLEESASAMQRQAEALEAAGAALAETAALVRRQGELFEQTVTTMHRPWRIVESAAGVRSDGAPPVAAQPPAAGRTSTRKRTSRVPGRS